MMNHSDEPIQHRFIMFIEKNRHEKKENIKFLTLLHDYLIHLDNFSQNYRY